MTTYHLPITVVADMMTGFYEPVTLLAHLSAFPDVLKQESVATIVVGAHGLQECVITEKSTRTILFQHEEAFHLLQRCGMLEWTLLQADTSHTREQLSGYTMQPIESIRVRPSRQVALSLTKMQALPHTHKQIFALINGRNTIEHIASLLTKSPQQVYDILLELKQQHFISLE